MKLLVVLLVLAARQWFPAEAGNGIGRLTRQWRDLWLGRAAAAAGLTLALVAGLPVVVVALLCWSTADMLYGVPEGLLSLLVLAWVLLDRHSPDAATRLRNEWLGRSWGPEEPDLLSPAPQAALAFDEGRRLLLGERLAELFSPLFWFLLLGPVALVAYYLLRVLAELAGLQPAGTLADRLLHWADWLPARVLALSLALAGNFVETWSYLRGVLLDTQGTPQALLDGACSANTALDVAAAPDASTGASLVLSLAEVDALLQRALVVWIVLLALHTLWP